MRRGPRFAWFGAGLAALGTVLFSASDARAGSFPFGTGIIITGGNPIPVGDPSYDYQLDVVLSAGTTLETGGYFTVYDVPDLVGKPLTSAPNLQWGASSQYLGVSPTGYAPTPADDPNIYNVTFAWNGAPISAGQTDLELGIFTIGRTIDLSSPPLPMLQYVGSLDGTSVSNGNYVQIALVPEPSSIVLLLAGAAVLPASAAFRRRKQGL